MPLARASRSALFVRLGSELPGEKPMAMLPRDFVLLAAGKGMMRQSTGPELEAGGGLEEPQLTLVSPPGGRPDPRLVELVRILARRAARRWYAEQVEAQRQRDRSGPSST